MKILIAGDYCPRGRVSRILEESEFNFVFGSVLPITQTADYCIVNLECPICNGNEQPILKSGPNLMSSPMGIKALRWAGFDCVTLANNHFLDYGYEGVKNTLSVCQTYNIATVGGGLNLNEASKVFYLDIKGEKLAIINCCEHEFSIATETTAGSNPLDPIEQFYSIQEAKTKADLVLVIVHGGHEHFQYPSLRMQKLYRFFIDAGADAVINHHQHCYSGHELYKDKPIFYGVGNFCFDNFENFTHEKPWNFGYMVMIENSCNENIRAKIYPYRQCAEKPSIEMLNPDALDIVISGYNIIIEDENKLKEINDAYYESQNKSIAMILEPLSIRLLNGLQRRGMIPLFQSKRKLTILRNYILCESHREKIKYYLENLLNRK